MEEEEEGIKHFIGFDFSTQQIKAVVINESLELTAEANVHFDSMLPEYRTHGGVNISGSTVTAPTIMWVKALDMLLDKLRVEGVDFSSIGAISGAGQQHGSVYWRTGGEDMLSNLQPTRFMHDQLGSAFSILDSPIWMDSSTAKQCAQLEEGLGGAETLTALTGSRAYHRFTANQIKKISSEKKEAYANTERISLVSSFAASLFVGRVVGIDWSDGSGMNLLNITNKTWVPQILNTVGENLQQKLGDPIATDTVVGTVSTYMQDRYGFSPDCLVGAFTGDNCSSLAGLGMKEGDIGYSLGTSDTVFAWLSEPNPQLTGHIFTNPVDTSAYMAMLCYKNGSLTRERIRGTSAEGSWEKFNNLLDSTPRGNFGNLGFYFDHPEIVPADLQGDFRFNKSDEAVAKFSSEEVEIRALVEGQVLAKRLHAQTMGFRISEKTRVLVTGGASVNKSLLQVISDVFNCKVFTLTGANSAASGGAYRALHLYKGGTTNITYSQVITHLDKDLNLSAEPNRDAESTYGPLLERYRILEQTIIQQFSN